ncbi:glycosyltransferase [Winogradskyella algicola]|uniref:glycosyltransferase n=1 Tax=Winogradskyella algicola TaxID=2575815 RepID=UPI0011094E9A|nr:glycosyltransferase [Winogradskyella algicola]
MRIVYLITTKGHGKGGHFHSLNTIANTIGQVHDVHVINVGVQRSESLDSSSYKMSFVNYNGYNFFKVFLKLKKIVKHIQPQVVHAFDVESFAFGRLLSANLGQSSYLNKCGGPNPKLYYPKADNLVLFSHENQHFFDEHRKYQKVNKVLIPNRVLPVYIDEEKVKAFKEKHKINTEITILRIARIGNHYHKSILQGINLVKWLAEQGCDIKFIILGTIQSEDIYRDILDYINQNNISNHVIIETDDKFTYNASRVLSVGDIIIGTGRNFMEASSLGQILLVPYKDDDYPLLVDNHNFNQVFETNFSPRTKVDNYDSKLNLENILSLVQSNDRNINSKKWFNSFFNVNEAVNKYTELYNVSDNRKLFLLDVILNILYSIKGLVIK